MNLNWKIFALVTILLTGCASGPNWQHTKIADKTTASRQLAIDDGHCTLIAEGGAPMSQVTSVEGLKTTDVTQSAQDEIYKSCMYAKDWVDTPAQAMTAVAAAAPVTAQPLKRLTETSVDVKIYKTQDYEWFADLEEFLRFHPVYKKPALYEVLRLQLVDVGSAEPNLSMPQRLVKAHDKIAGQALTATEKADAVLMVYLGAVNGVARDQAGLGLFYAQGKDSRTPVNTTRSAYWAQKSALGGNAVCQMVLGIMLFSGGIQQDKVNGYLWVKKAGASGLNVANTLRGFEEEMSAEQLSAVQ